MSRLQRFAPLLVFVVIALAHGAFVLAYGVRSGKDTLFYEALAERLIASGFNYTAAFADAEQSYPMALYSTFVTLCAALKLIAGDGWKIGVVILNLAAQAGAGVLLYRLTVRLTGSVWAGALAVGLVVVSFPMAEWAAYALSDTTAMFIGFAVFCLAADRMLQGKGSWLPVFALAFAAALYRPTGVILPPLVLLAFGLAHSQPAAAGGSPARRWPSSRRWGSY